MSQDATNKRSDEIRQSIDQTRQQMDQTIEELTGRLKGRHLADEVIGIFRSHVPAEKMEEMKNKVTQTTNSAVNSVVNSVKSNPWPALLIGAGVAWLVFSSRRSRSRSNDEEYLEGPYDSDLSDETGYELSGGGYGAADLSDYESADLTVGESGNFEKGASDLGSKVQEQSRQILTRSRERVVQTVDQHPIELGLGVLAIGIIAGLAIPTPSKVNEVVGPRADRLRERAREAGREWVNKGKNVVQAAANAAKQEAQAQGLSPEALKEKAAAVGQRTQQAATDQARKEGLGGQNENGSTANSGAQPQTAGQTA